MLNLYNDCLKTGTFPSRWKGSLLVTIHKGPDKEKTNPKSYRPICLLPNFEKILEGLTLTRLRKYLNKDRESKRQYGFKKDNCTEDAIHALTEEVRQGEKEEKVKGIFLDIKGAFDNVWWPAILAELKLRSCPQNLYVLIQDYLNDRERETSKSQKWRPKDAPKGQY